MDYIKLNNGNEMPILGFGVYQIPPQDCERVVLEAIEVGYRSIDTAQAYYNEEEVGKAVKSSNIDRSKFFITTKIWVSNAGYERAKKSFEESLKKLQTEYVDLLLIHQPFGDYYGTYRALEEMYKSGKAKAIGVSNFYPDRLVDLCEHVEIKPAVNQVETHIFNQQKISKEVMKEYGTQIESWGPFAEGKNNFFTNETLVSISKKYNKTPAQIALRFLIQQQVIVIPKSTHKERMIENFNVFDFKLSEEDIHSLESLDQEKSLFFSHNDHETVRFILDFKKKHHLS